MHIMHSMHIRVGERIAQKCALILVGYVGVCFGFGLNGVQVVGGSNPLAPTKKVI